MLFTRFHDRSHAYKAELTRAIKCVHSVVPKLLGITVKELQSRNRRKELVMRRKCLAVVLCWEYNWTLHAVGRLLDRDHTSVLHYLQWFTKTGRYDAEHIAMVKDIMDKLPKLTSCYTNEAGSTK